MDKGLLGSFAAILISPGIPIIDQPSDLLWVFIISCFAAFLVAYGIGANDVANSFGTSVGSGALTIRWALIIAAVMEFTGAVALGQAVTETIRSGIADPKCFEDGDESELMLGMMCSLISSATWLLIASFLGLPVSTTHSTVGAIIGFTIASQGVDCVEWGWGKDGKGFAGIALSWVISPVASGLLGIAIYLLVIIFIVKAPNPLQRGYQSIPVILGLTSSVIMALVFFKSPATKNVENWVSWVVVISSLVFFSVVGYFVGIPMIKKFMIWRAKGLPYDTDGETTNLEEKDEAKSLIHNPQKQEREIKEKEVDKIFVFFQVLTASFESFAHGANDTANAIGPFAAVYFLYITGSPQENVITPWWILAAGGVGIVIGLATFGKRVMDTIGKKLTKINFTRGFSIELSSTLCVVLASRLGFPVSTTHCQVGSVVAVGVTNQLLYKTRWAPAEPLDSMGVSWKTFVGVGISWLVTVPVSAMVASGMFGWLVHSLVLGYKVPSNSTVPINDTLFSF